MIHYDTISNGIERYNTINLGYESIVFENMGDLEIGEIEILKEIYILIDE